MNTECTGIILAGGQNKRFSGRCKAFARVGGIPIIDRIFSLFRELFHEIVIVTNEPEKYFRFDCTIMTDIYPVRTSLTGLHAGLFATRTPFAFAAACDTPFLKKELILTILGQIGNGHDVIVPETPMGMEPLCAAYRTTCLKPIERGILLNRFQIIRFFKEVKVKKFPPDLVSSIDPEFSSFFNVNTPEDLEKAENYIHSRKNLNE